jgi:uncharacterized protein YcfL
MKKVIAIFAVATALVACGGNASTEVVTTDSTVVAVDSLVADTSTAALDSTFKADPVK